MDLGHFHPCEFMGGSLTSLLCSSPHSNQYIAGSTHFCPAKIKIRTGGDRENNINNRKPKVKEDVRLMPKAAVQYIYSQLIKENIRSRGRGGGKICSNNRQRRITGGERSREEQHIKNSTSGELGMHWVHGWIGWVETDSVVKDAITWTGELTKLEAYHHLKEERGRRRFLECQK